MSSWQPAIGDYALIGDGRSAALIDREGSIDWLCWPRFESDALLSRLLDPDRGGCWRLGPTSPARVERRYLPETNVLETRFITEDSECVLTDAMLACDEDEKARRLVPDHEILRRLECIRGQMTIEHSYRPSPHFGLTSAHMTNRGAFGLQFFDGREQITLRGELPPSEQRHLRAGESLTFSLTSDADAPAVLPPLGEGVRERLRLTADFWRRWARRATYEGPDRERVLRSALVVKLLSYAPTGAIIAAPTTSLPERLGGDLNWDYRFCWLRDAAFSARAFLGLGYLEEASAYASWLLHSTRLTWPRLSVLYDVFGRDPVPERSLPMAGYRDSRPVRVGNAAVHQVQLDVYGEVIDAVAMVARTTGHLDRESQRMLRGLATYVARHGREPDSGIWEDREPPRHYTFSRAMCWAALDRALDLHQRGLLPELRAAEIRREEQLLRAEIEQRGYNPQLGSYTRELDGDTLDTSLLLLPWSGLDSAASPRMQGTWERLRERLEIRPGLFVRDEPSRLRGEGAFGICSFWAVDFLARAGRLDEAQDVHRAICDRANDVGLFAEEVDPATGDPLGNFPQSYTHVGLINAALTLSRQEERLDEVRTSKTYEREAQR